jgi:hypothetical protein
MNGTGVGVNMIPVRIPLVRRDRTLKLASRP